MTKYEKKRFLRMTPQRFIDSGYVRAGETGETALEGLYVAGDARTKKLRQVVTAVSDGANAATAVAEYLK